MFKDNQTIDILNNPFNYLSLVSDWITLPRKEKQRIISHYIDSIDIERHGDDFKIININFLSSFITEQQENHNKYDTSLSLNIFQSSDGYPIRVNPEFRTNEQARKYFDKLDKYMNSKINCKLNYYDVIFDCNIMDGTYPATDNESVIRAILIEDKKLKLDNKLKIGIITLDVSEMKKVCTPKVYGFIMKACEEYKKDFKNFISKIPV